jgi:hypothetical protein
MRIEATTDWRCLGVGIMIGFPVWYQISEMLLRHSKLPWEIAEAAGLKITGTRTRTQWSKGAWAFMPKLNPVLFEPMTRIENAAKRASRMLLTAPDISAKKDEVIVKELQEMRDAATGVPDRV